MSSWTWDLPKVTWIEKRREARRHRREELERTTIPLRLYGVRRGTVVVVTVVSILFAIFTLIPIAWIVINSTKTQPRLFSSFGFWFAAPFHFIQNFKDLFKNVDGEGIFTHWFVNTALYAVVGGSGATALSALGGYAFARFEFPGHKVLFFAVLGSLLIPVTAVSLPLYFVFAKVHLVNSIWGFILPSMVSVVGVYLMRIFIETSVPVELIEAARMDGASEFMIFLRIAVPLMVPGLMTVLLLSVVGIWNNYFLPLLLFSKASLYPLTVGLGFWGSHASVSGDQLLYPLLVMGGLMTLLPLVLLFLFVQRYWRAGALIGSITG